MFDEPKDMFEGVEAAPKPPSIQPPAGAVASAFNPPPSAVNVISDEHVQLAAQAAESRGRSGGRGLLFAAALVAIVVVVGGGVGFWYYQQAARSTLVENLNVLEPTDNLPPLAPVIPAAPAAPTESTVPPVEPALPVVPVMDSDGDGLTDARESEIGTSIVNNDTDGDALGDREEVDVYGTDPLRPDTDSDTFTDGSEVSNGYNPNGPGRILDIPTGP